MKNLKEIISTGIFACLVSTTVVYAEEIAGIAGSPETGEVQPMEFDKIEMDESIKNLDLEREESIEELIEAREARIEVKIEKDKR